jgi:hypothetical protein
MEVEKYTVLKAVTRQPVNSKKTEEASYVL